MLHPLITNSEVTSGSISACVKYKKVHLIFKTHVIALSSDHEFVRSPDNV